MNIDALPSTFLLTNMQIQQLTSLLYNIVENHVQVIQHCGHFYHLKPDLVFDVYTKVLCPVRAKDPMTKDQESIVADNDCGQPGYLKSLNGTT
jgi:hypothetical protein